jgi:hypothetical protein
MEFLCPLATIWIASIVIAGAIGNRKGEGFLSAFLAVFLGPIAILIAMVSSGNRVKCPFCKELINKDAIKCPRCQSNLQLNLNKN